jgi:hypothetical protein
MTHIARRSCGGTIDPHPTGTRGALETGTWIPAVILRRLALLLVPLALVACATPGPSVVSVPSRVGPSGLLVRLDYGWKGFGHGRHSADYLAGGTVIRWNGTGCGGYGEPCGTLEQNTLTASGLTAFRALLTQDADLLAAPMVFQSQVRPGTNPIGHGDLANTFVLERADGTRYMVEVPSTTSADAGTWVQDPTITRLNALAEAMLDPATVVGAGGLVDPTWTAYQPTAAAVIVMLTPSAKPVPFDGPYGTDLQKIGWPLGGTPDTFGSTFPSPSGEYSHPGHTYRCAFLANDATVKAISSGIPPGNGGSLVARDLVSGATGGAGLLRWGDEWEIGIWATTLLPEDVAGSCDDAFAY